MEFPWTWKCTSIRFSRVLSEVSVEKSIIGYARNRVYMAKQRNASWEAPRFSRAPGSAVRAVGPGTEAEIPTERTPFAGVVYFFGSYLVYGGWMDGSAGFAFALLKMSYFTQIYCRIRELECKDS